MMRSILVLGALLMALAGACSSSGGKKLCKQAADKYAACMGEILGKEAAALARSKEKAGIAACSRDTASQKMYRKCLPEKTCKAFLKCMEDFAHAHRP